MHNQEGGVSGEELVASASDGLGLNPGIDAGAPGLIRLKYVSDTSMAERGAELIEEPS